MEEAPRAAVAPVLAVAAAAGAGTMVVELAAVRLLAPWFGTSASVWANVIGVILLALALGYLLGARLAARRGVLARLSLLLVLGAGLAAWLPYLAGPVCRLFLPAGALLHEAAELLRWGSLAASLVLFLPPALCLGAAGPLAVEAVQVRSGVRAGTAGGEVLAVSTLGSLVGTFATAEFLVPVLGLERTFQLAAALLLLAGAVAFLLARREAAVRSSDAGPGSAGVLSVLALCVPASLLAPVRGPALPEGVRLLAAEESPYQAVRVVEDRGGEFRRLQVNEGFDSFQSVWQPEPGLLPESYYYNDFVLPAWFEAASGRWRVLVLGLGGGTTLRVLEGALPAGVALEAVGVELDPVVVKLAREHMDLAREDAGQGSPSPGAPSTRIASHLDARCAVRLLAADEAQPAFDQVVLDTYANQVEIPAHLSSVEWFRELAGVLRPGGWLTVNTGGFALDDPIVQAVAATVAEAFGQDTLVLRVPASRNFTIFARRGSAPPRPGDAAWQAVPRELAAALLDKRAIDSAWRLVPPGSPGVLTDDRNPIAMLQLRSIREARRHLEGSRP